MKKKNYMFSNKKHSQRGITASVLGLIAFISLAITMILTYLGAGEPNKRLAVTTLFSLLISIAGLVFGIIARTEKEIYYLFPRIGIFLNLFVMLVIGFILFFGVYL